MKSDGTGGSTAAARLRDLVSPDLVALLASGQQPPAALVEGECARLHADLAAMATYIPTPIVAAQLAAPQPGLVSGAYWRGSVLFADLNGFTALSERLSALGRQGAEELSAIINRLFGALTEEIHRHSGEVLKFGGDALTVFFDAATLGQRHAWLASQAALALNRRMDEFAALATRAGTFRLRLRVGVHSGQVFAAQVGDNDHIELVVTGHDINRVALAQEIAVPGQVVISDATAALLPDASTLESQHGFVQLLDMPAGALPAPAALPVPPRGDGGLEELLALAERIEALRPSMPRGLPRRFLEPFGSAMGEFRTVSVLFANFFPFSDLLDLLPGEADTAARLLNAYYRRAQQIVHHYGGIVNKVDMYTHGDKLMALFGAPVAHEDDPLLSVRAALELRDSLQETNAEIAGLLAGRPGLAFEGFVQRIGIHTGVVFAGQVGGALRREYTVMGQHVNMAARLMSAAEFGTVLLSPASRRAVERHIAVREYPPLMLKGLSEPVQPSEAVAAREVAQDPRHSIGRAALIGRDEELNELLFEGSVALAGSGRVVTLVGEAGTGKTRLIEDTLRSLVMRSGEARVPAFFAYSVECQSYEQTSPYAVLRELLRQMFNLRIYRAQAASEDIPAEALLARVAELVPELARFAPLLGDLIGVALPDTPLTAALTPEQRHDRGQELVEALVLAEAGEQPLVLIIDDMQWADASSLELIARVARLAPRAPLLLLLGYRDDPPIAEPWRELEHCRRLLIRELSPESSAALVRALLGDDPPAQLTALLERAQGNPFFIEEVVRDLVELGALRRDDASGWQLAETFDEAAIPDSIEGVITARLDRLEERSREVLQTAAVIGRRFAYQVLSGVVPLRDSLIDRLGQLSAADLIILEDLEAGSDTIAPLLAYLFKHALTRDVAYEAILYARRRDLHRRVARHMEQIYADRLDEHLALLARHYLLAEEWPPAFDYHLRAGRQAQARYANREAITLLGRALQIAAQQADASWSPPPAAVTELRERLGVIHALLGEYDAALAHYEAALAPPDLPRDAQVRLHYLVARVYEKRAEFDTAFGWVERALALADDPQDPERIPCLLLGAGLHKRQGRYSQAGEWCEHALRLAEQHERLRDQAQAFKLLGNIANSLGDNSRALELIRRSLAIYEQIHDLDGISYAHNDLAIIYHDLGRLSEARTHYEAGAEIKQAIGDIYGQGMIACNLGEVFRIQNKINEAISQYSKGLEIYERIGSPYMMGVLHMNLGAAYFLNSDLAKTEQHLNRSAELFLQAGAEEFLPELERYQAELHIQYGDLLCARQICEQALRTAARLEARTEEGATRRTLSQIMILSGEQQAAWDELEHSLAILRDAASLHEIAKTLLRMADLSPALGHRSRGQAALTEAWPALNEVGAQRDIAEARVIAERYGYDLPV